MKYQSDADLPVPEELLERIMSSHNIRLENGQRQLFHIFIPLLLNLYKALYSWSEKRK
jgi:hypothetical protein